MTDFPRYAEVVGTSVDDLVSEANSHYQQGLALNESGDHQSAITAYEAAFDLFPMFFEAIDNLAFSLMDIGDFQAALEGFEHSLQINPDGVHAFFSRGECMFKLGKFSDAADIFRDGMSRFPEETELFREHLRRAEAMARE